MIVAPRRLGLLIGWRTAMITRRAITGLTLITMAFTVAACSGADSPEPESATEESVPAAAEISAPNSP